MILQFFLEFGARDGNHGALEELAEMRGQFRPDFIGAHGAIQDAFERRSAFAGNAAWHDQVKVSQIGGNIVREAMRSDPAAEVHAEGGEFFFACGLSDPYAVAIRDAFGRDFEIGRRADHGFFELLDVPAHVATEFGEIKDGIADNLSGAVIGDVATAVGCVEGDVHLCEQAVTGAEMFFFSVAAERDHVGVLAEQQHVGNGAGFAGFDELLLQMRMLGRKAGGLRSLASRFFLVVARASLDASVIATSQANQRLPGPKFGTGRYKCQNNFKGAAIRWARVAVKATTYKTSIAASS